MNERIRELLKQAEERYPRHLAVAVPEVVLRQDALEKFAQLIVEKCAGIIESQDVDPSFRNRMSWAVKQYFGVKS